MNDTTLAAHLLPPELIIKNFIHGEPDCNYEKFLLEFVNNSDFFVKNQSCNFIDRHSANQMVNVTAFQTNIS